VDYQDFGFFRMALAEIYFVGGFGSMGWVVPDDYGAASVDPLADSASDLIRELNTEQAETLLLLARALGDVDAQQATVTALDRLGFHLRFTTPGRMQGGRVAFPGPVCNESEVRAGLTGLAAQANAGLQVLHSL
jgi:heme iron utilization protein